MLGVHSVVVIVKMENDVIFSQKRKRLSFRFKQKTDAFYMDFLLMFDAVLNRRGLLKRRAVVFCPHICVLALSAVFQEDKDS